MRKRCSATLAVTFGLCIVSLATVGRLAAEEKILHSFGTKANDGGLSQAGLVFDVAGNLYGVAPTGGASGLGVIFELSPAGQGGWFERVLTSAPTTMVAPTSILTLDSVGNLYGTGFQNGNTSQGVAFELKHWPNGGWSEVVLHQFNGMGDGTFPVGGIIPGGAGKFYGITSQGGAHGLGIAYELLPAPGGGWTEKILHSFAGGADGAGPYGNMILDAAGNLYGTTPKGGAHHIGTVFELSPAANGNWTEKVIFNFGTLGNGTGGSQPFGGVIFDTAGNLYGTTNIGGAQRRGVAYRLSPVGNDTWTETVLHTFGTGFDGTYPFGSLAFDAAGNLYGTTVEGGAFDNHTGGGGTVYKLTPTAGGRWIETILQNFGAGTDGINPFAGVILDASGNLYGTTWEGGTQGQGTVFEITP